MRIIKMKRMLSSALAIIMLSMLSVSVGADSAAPTLSETEATIFGNSSFEWSHKSWGNSDNAADGTYTKFDGGGATITATKTFYVDKNGDFELEVRAASSATNSSLSNLAFKIDDGSSIVLSGTNSTVTALQNPCRTDAPWTTKAIKYNTAISLDAGEHTITFRVPKNSNGKSAAYFVFDCAVFSVVAPQPNQLITDEDNVLEFERYHTSNVKDSSGASGGKVVDFKQYSATEQIIDMVFDIEKTGDYTLVLDASVEQGVTGAQTHLSPAYISVNGESEIEISNSKQSNFSITSDATYTSEWPPSRITLAKKFALSEGENSIKIRVAARKSGDMVVGTFDCIRLVRAKSITSITADFGNGIVKRGENATIKLKNQSGETVTSMDFSKITYTSSNSDVAEVQNGILKAKNYGHSVITVSAVSNGQTLEAQCYVEVISEKGIWLNSLEKTDNGMKVNIKAAENYSGVDRLLICVYGQKDGTTTSLKTSGTATTSEMAENTEANVEISLADIKTGDIVRVFLLDSANLKRAIYTKLTYGGVGE